MSKQKYADPLLNIAGAGEEMQEKIRSVREIVEELNFHAGIIEGYLYGATRKQLAKDPETLAHFINYLGVVTGALSVKAAELDQSVPEMRDAARGLADSEEAGNGKI
ncbi:hypothetical protein HMPREF1862_00575 [Varibaculum cambriense]|uniref:Uncharacterized protein n=1 Tax=Varibaculum cambriense TaxID=184870 RepID=A0AB34X2U7_9ACTO|nr:hypothetical protein [Varibaculum cambriense]KXB81303.1 hypothetical protein HMPREF1862_00575 [Varibaculum cambriense]